MALSKYVPLLCIFHLETEYSGHEGPLFTLIIYSNVLKVHDTHLPEKTHTKDTKDIPLRVPPQTQGKEQFSTFSSEIVEYWSFILQLLKHHTTDL